MILNKKTIKTPLDPINSMLFERYQIHVWVKREDLNHPTIQGNKWHKLKGNLQTAKQSGKFQLLTLGGAYSNHIAATAAAAKSMGWNSIGIIRGDELENQTQKWSHTLKQAQANGMQFEFVSRKSYRNKDNPDYIQELQAKYPNAYILPEGGSNYLAIMGFKELMKDINEQCPDWHQIYTAVGTGGTISGLIHFANQSQFETLQKRELIGIPVLQQGEYLIPQIQQWLTQAKDSLDNQSPHSQPNTFFNEEFVSWKLLTQYHEGGYGKQSDRGNKFQHDFEEQFEILLDPVYTSKAFFAFFDQLKAGKIKPGSNIILLHTGGLQGRN